MAAQVENARRYDPMVGKCFESLPISEGGRVCVRIPVGDMVRYVFFVNGCSIVDRDEEVQFVDRKF